MITELGRMYDVASDNESAMLDDLALRAGIRWQCPEPCRWMNREEDRQCGGCGRERGICAACAYDPEGGVTSCCKPGARCGNYRSEAARLARYRAAYTRITGHRHDGETADDREREVTTGSETGPGMYFDGGGSGEWIAWDYDPGDTPGADYASEPITVYASDLGREG